MGRAAHRPPARSHPGNARLYAKGPNSIILYCMGVTQQVTGTRTCGALANLVMLCGMIGRPSTGLIPLRGQNNVQGSCDMGALPRNPCPATSRRIPSWGTSVSPGSGARSPTSRARSSPKSWTGCATEHPGGLHHGREPHAVRSGRGKSRSRAAEPRFPHRTGHFHDAHGAACRRDPAAASYLEKQGTFTNTERRVQLINEVLPPCPAPAPTGASCAT